MVQLELAKWLTREVGEDKADWVIAFTETRVVADLDTYTALSAAAVCAKYKLSTADVMVYVPLDCMAPNVSIRDRHFEKLPNVKFALNTGRLEPSSWFLIHRAGLGLRIPTIAARQSN